MLHSAFRRTGYQWLFIILMLGLLVVENLPANAVASASVGSNSDLASLPLMYD